MTESATEAAAVAPSSTLGLREWKKVETTHRITLCAQQLADERGLDGFTMDDLAEAAEVSRRTLFNYFPSKLDAVLGAVPELPPADIATFHAGGPHGNLLDDVAELARIVLAVKQPDREALERIRRLLAADPRLLAAAHERFETVIDEFAAFVTEREGPAYGADRARLLLRLLLSLFDSALHVLVSEDSDRTIAEVFDEQLALARRIFA